MEIKFILMVIGAYILGVTVSQIITSIRGRIGELHVDPINNKILLEFYKTIPELELHKKNYIIVKVVVDDLKERFSQENLDL